MATDFVPAVGAESESESLEGTLVLLGLGYLAIVCLAVYADYIYKLRRARKRREAGYTAKDLEWFQKGEDDEPSPRR